MTYADFPLLVLLPGTDGTGTFFGPLQACLADHANTRVVAYPQCGNQSYEVLGALILAELPADQDYVLVGESFGGPLAIWLAANAPRKPVKLVLAASFAASPFGFPGRLIRPLLWLGRWLPLWTWQINLILFNNRQPRTAKWVHDAVRLIDRATLLARIQSVLSCDMLDQLPSLDMPVLCLNARRDRLVWPWLPRHFPDRPGLRVVELDLPHMIFQSDPDGIARDILLPFLRS